MVKKFSTLALAALLAVPSVASAGGNADLAAQIQKLTQELNKLKAQMETVQEQSDDIEERAEKWDLASRFQWSGDFRTRYDYYTRDRKTSTTKTVVDTNSSLVTNRLRLNLRVKATEDIEFKGRLAMYKAWGMQSAPADDGYGYFGGFPGFDGNVSRQPNDSSLYVDRAFINWNNIAGQPIWFSIGRRPTTDGAPNQLRLGADKRMATPVAYMDWAFDGFSLGYAYENLPGLKDFPGRIRICYGVGFEAGLQNKEDMEDTAFGGLSWDIYKKGNTFAYLQSFAAVDVFNFPDWEQGVTPGSYTASGDYLYGYSDSARKNLGNIYHTSAVYMSKYNNLNYFGAAGFSLTDPNKNGMMNDYSTVPSTGSATVNRDNEDGYHFLVGLRYDFENQPFKVGAEYGHGSKYWIGMTPGHDDMYAAKLATRGDTYELYGIWDLPAGDILSKFGKAFMRLGYIHYEYDYTGSMDWNVMPYDVDKTEAFYANYAGQDVIDSADQVYLTMEAWF